MYTINKSGINSSKAFLIKTKIGLFIHVFSLIIQDSGQKINKVKSLTKITPFLHQKYSFQTKVKKLHFSNLFKNSSEIFIYH